MRQGKIVEEFDVKNKSGEKLRVVFRHPSKKDARHMLRLVNSARDEAEYLGMRHHETMRTEREFIAKQLENMKKKRGICLFVEVNGELAGNSVIRPLEFDVSPHVGHFGIMLHENFTGIGIGTRLMRKMLQLARTETGFKVIESGYAAKNRRSVKLHRRFGFRRYGRFPKELQLRDGTYCDHVYVCKTIKKL